MALLRKGAKVMARWATDSDATYAAVVIDVDAESFAAGEVRGGRARCARCMG